MYHQFVKKLSEKVCSPHPGADPEILEGGGGQNFWNSGPLLSTAQQAEADRQGICNPQKQKGFRFFRFFFFFLQ